MRTGPGAQPSGPLRRSQRSGRGPSSPLKSGEKIDRNLGRTLGSYKILSLIGSGGMGQVYLAEHVMLGRRVALKLLRPEYAVKTDAVHRFFQEARAVNTIGHENIVDITDFVELDTGETFFIMELLKGRDLGDVLRKSDRRVPLDRAMQIAIQVSDGLEAAHSKAIVHRDLKPDNIFILDTNKPTFVKLLDFGVAKLLGSAATESSWQTAAGSVIGTPAYMSPEQASGIPVDGRSDIYSLGAILYELFTGYPVFRAKSFGEYVVKHINDIPVAPRDLPNAPKIPLTLERVILRCLEKDPDNRYPSVTALKEDLVRATGTVETVVRDVKQRRRDRTGLVIGAVAGLVLLAIGAFWLAAGLGTGDLVDGTHDTGAGTTPPAKIAPPPLAGVPAKQRLVPRATPIREQTARITLHTDPVGADVYRAGDPTSLGRTPLTLNLKELGDRIEFRFRKPGYTEVSKIVRVLDNTVESVALERLPAITPQAPEPPPPKTVRKRRHKRPRGTRKRKHTGGNTIDPGAQIDPEFE